MMVKNMKKISDLFHVQYGNSLDLASMNHCNKIDKNAVNFVSRTSKNNGVSGIVEKIAGTELCPSGTLTVAVGGSVMEAFLQPEPYYTGYHVLILAPIMEMSDCVKLYYCACIRANKYKYNYGRQANKTLKDIMVPNIDEIPEFVFTMKTSDYSKINCAVDGKSILLDPLKWKSFRYDKIFNVKKGKRITKMDLIPGGTPFLSAIDGNNGIREYSGLVALHSGNTITVNYNGSVGEAFYQERPFWASDDINVLYPQIHLNKYIAMFLITLIRQEKYRYNYGRKWHKERMEESTIKLPVKADGTPDCEFMERYIKSLPYSASI